MATFAPPEAPRRLTDTAEESTPEARAALTERVRSALSDSDELARQGRISALLANMTASNWPSIMHGFATATLQDGRKNDSEWEMAMKRIGQVAGADGMNYYFQEGVKERNMAASGQCLKGFATAHPDEARSWYTQLPDGVEKSQLRGALVVGLTESAPGKARDFVEALPPQERIGSVGDLVIGTIQSAGYGAANQLLAHAADLAKDGDAANAEYASAIFKTYSDRVFQISAQHHSPETACRWLDDNLGKPYVTPGVVAKAAANYANEDPARALDWLEASVASRGDASLLQAGAQGLVARWNDEAGIATWLNNHPTDQLYDPLAQSYARRIAGKDPDAARQWIENIKDEAVKAAARQWLDQFLQNRRPQPVSQ
ncbi:MAG TPA: hypothetical protein VGL71_09760 [Urbifossiella sp.]|jgi:hypothetical protein